MSDKIINFLDRYKLPLGLILVGVVLIIGGLMVGSKPQPKDYPKASLVESQKTITVDVSGAVNKPGVYQLKEGQRIEDAVSLAGGFSSDANSEYVAKVLNLATKLVDGSKIYVPKVGEGVSSTSNVSGVSATNTATKININSASSSELDTLPGIGEVTAQKIISGRPYQTTDELLTKKVVSKSVYDKIKDQLVVY